MKETLNDTDDKEDMMIEDRETQKKLVHPYRKYQLWIIVMVILSIILGITAFNLNSELDTLLKTEHNLFLQVVDLKEESKEIQKVYERVEVNYKDIYGLDKKKNIDIIHDHEELNKLSNAINEQGSVSYSICFKASLDGESPDTFRKACDGISPLLFLIETTDGYRFAAPAGRDGRHLDGRAPVGIDRRQRHPPDRIDGRHLQPGRQHGRGADLRRAARIPGAEQDQDVRRPVPEPGRPEGTAESGRPESRAGQGAFSERPGGPCGQMGRRRNGLLPGGGHLPYR